METRKRRGPTKRLPRPTTTFCARYYDDALRRIEGMALTENVDKAEIVRRAIDFFLARHINSSDIRETEPIGASAAD